MLIPTDRILEGLDHCPAGAHDFAYRFLTLMILKNVEMSENARSKGTWPV